MNIELINTGTELMLGRVLNTHQQWLCRQLADAGYRVQRQVAVPDTGVAIQEAVREALGRADLVITTGGLGPTSDDITRDLIAELLGKPLREDEAITAHIRSFFEARKRPMPERTRIQAMVPESATVLPNPNGTAPGLAMRVSPNPYRESRQASWIIMLPGPPRELRPMFTATALPLIRQVLPLPEPFVCKTFRTTGLGESVLEERLVGPIASAVANGLELGYCAHIGQVDVRVAASGMQANRIVSEAETIVRELFGKQIYGEEDVTLEASVVKLLRTRELSLAVAESCTGGLLSHRITNVPGASNVFLGGVISYSNLLKQALLQVREEAIAAQGAVSELVARQMAEGAREATRANWALSITGIAGPEGGTAEKPVGTVFIGLAGPGVTKVTKQFNPYDRETFKQATTNQALETLRQALLE